MSRRLPSVPLHLVPTVRTPNSRASQLQLISTSRESRSRKKILDSSPTVRAELMIGLRKDDPWKQLASLSVSHSLAHQWNQSTFSISNSISASQIGVGGSRAKMEFRNACLYCFAICAGDVVVLWFGERRSCCGQEWI